MPDSTRPRSSHALLVAPALGADSPLAALPLPLQALFWTTFTAAVEAALAAPRPVARPLVAPASRRPLLPCRPRGPSAQPLLARERWR